MTTPAARALWERLQRRASARSPKVAADLLRGLRTLEATLTDAEVKALVASGGDPITIARVLSDARVGRAFGRMRAQIQEDVAQETRIAGRALPAAARDLTLATPVFHSLNPLTLVAVKRLDTKVMQKIATTARETVREVITDGHVRGVNPREMARALRSTLGLAKNQLKAVQNFNASLKAGHLGKARAYTLRDKRFTLKKGTVLTEARIKEMTDAYRRRMIAWQAETVARTAALDSAKLGQHLAQQTAVEKGFLDGTRLFKQWSGVLDERERDEHLVMEGETVPWNQTFSNGEFLPGDSTYNCRCIVLYPEGDGVSVPSLDAFDTARQSLAAKLFAPI